jgi:hypothetical protein
MNQRTVRTTFAGLAALCWATAAVAADPPSYAIAIQNGAFAPAELTIPANTRVLLLVKNLNATPSEFESDDFHREKVVTGGDEIKVFVGPLLAGSYEFFDDFHPATRGRLIVK